MYGAKTRCTGLNEEEVQMKPLGVRGRRRLLASRLTGYSRYNQRPRPSSGPAHVCTFALSRHLDECADIHAYEGRPFGGPRAMAVVLPRPVSHSSDRSTALARDWRFLFARLRDLAQRSGSVWRSADGADADPAA